MVLRSRDARPSPAKRVRREYPWRPEYEREFGVRPIQIDTTTGDAVLVECRFCVSFGREPPMVPAVPPMNKAGQPIKSRARTRNVAHWKYPFRTDNIRSHHLQQHACKWTEYTTLLEQTKQQPPENLHVGGDAVDDREQTVSLRLNAFFGEASDSAAAVVATTPAPASVGAGLIRPTTMPMATVSPTMTSVLVPTITHAAIVDTVLSVFVDVPTSDTDAQDSEGAHLLVPVKATHNGIDGDTLVTQYVIESGDMTMSRENVRMLAAGLGFQQVADITSTTRSSVVTFVRAFVASSLERIAQLISVAWTYSVRLTVHPPTSESAPTSLRVSLVVAVDQSRDVQGFHIATLALYQTNGSQENVSMFIRALLSALDSKWEQKVLSVAVDGATHCLGVQVKLSERVLRPLLADPVVIVYDGRQDIDHMVQTAWVLFLRNTDGDVSFANTLFDFVARVRVDSQIVISLQHCPLVQLQDVRSVLHVLKWLILHRDALAERDIHAPLWWWLVAHVIVDVWTDCLVTVLDRVTESQMYDSERVREIVELLVKTMNEKCGVTTSKVNDKGRYVGDREAVEDVDFDESSRISTLGVESTGLRLNWSTRDITQWLRTLNVSTRRMMGEVAKDTISLRCTERQVSRFVLLLLSQLQRHASVSNPKSIAPISTTARPPTSPLDLAAMNPTDVVDFVETHSRRLEMAFSTVFLDRATREIRDLQALVSTNDQLRAELERVGDYTSPTAFAASWALVPQYPTARTFAAGLQTAMPLKTESTGPCTVFSRAENDQVPCGLLADLRLEAIAHACQLDRLQQAADDVPDVSGETGLVV